MCRETLLECLLHGPKREPSRRAWLAAMAAAGAAQRPACVNRSRRRPLAQSCAARAAQHKQRRRMRGRGGVSG
eukprot:6208605-Pleurochrysis_carterae.AAC.2